MAHEKYPEYSMEELFGLPVSVLYEMAHSEPGSYQPEFDLFDEHGGDGQPYKIILPIISNSSGLEATPTPNFEPDSDSVSNLLSDSSGLL